MAKWANDSVLDALLDKVGTANQILVTTNQPTTRANALSNSLASSSLTGGDFTKGDGTPNGRQIAIAQKSSVLVTDTGNATHVALVDSSDLLYVTTVTSQQLTQGNTVTIPSWTVTVADPS